MKLGLALAAASGFGLAFAALPASAHHAVQASVDIDKKVEMTVVLDRVDWINPHTWMHFKTTDAAGKTKNFAVESLGINALKQAGIDSKSAFHVGEPYKIAFYPNRDGTLGGFMYKMILPDGRVMDVTNADPAFAGKPTN